MKQNLIITCRYFLGQPHIHQYCDNFKLGQFLAVFQSFLYQYLLIFYSQTCNLRLHKTFLAFLFDFLREFISVYALVRPPLFRNIFHFRFHQFILMILVILFISCFFFFSFLSFLSFSF